MATKQATVVNNDTGFFSKAKSASKMAFGSIESATAVIAVNMDSLVQLSVAGNIKTRQQTAGSLGYTMSQFDEEVTKVLHRLSN